MRETPILEGGEWIKARCEGEGCDRTWEAHGTLNSRRVAARAQAHSDRTGHWIDVQWANRQPDPAAK